MVFLLSKLSFYGVTEKELVWFSDYLLNRNQVEYIENTLPNCDPIFCRFPLGSILGCVIYYIFKDLPEDIAFSSVIKYMNNAVIFFSLSNIDEMEIKYNRTIAKRKQNGAESQQGKKIHAVWNIGKIKFLRKISKYSAQRCPYVIFLGDMYLTVFLH